MLTQIKVAAGMSTRGLCSCPGVQPDRMKITLLTCAAASAQSHGAMGPSRVALAAVPVCAAWSAVAYSLGRRQQVLPWKHACTSSAAAEGSTFLPLPVQYLELTRCQQLQVLEQKAAASL